ncbi:MAG TPA: hypothetical protein VGL34_02960 [Steroidobacteraceae bacterium]
MTLPYRFLARNPSRNCQAGEYDASHRGCKTKRCQTFSLSRLIPVAQFIEADAKERRNNFQLGAPARIASGAKISRQWFGDGFNAKLSFDSRAEQPRGEAFKFRHKTAPCGQRLAGSD